VKLFKQLLAIFIIFFACTTLINILNAVPRDMGSLAVIGIVTCIIVLYTIMAILIISLYTLIKVEKYIYHR